MKLEVFNDYNSYQPHRTLVLLAANAVQGEKIGNLNIPPVLEYRVKTKVIVALVDYKSAHVVLAKVIKKVT